MPADELEERRAFCGERRVQTGQRRELRFVFRLAELLLEQARLAAEGNLLPMALTEFESEVHRELLRFQVAMGESRNEGFATPGRNLMRLAERIGYKVTRTAHDTVEPRRMDGAEMMAVFEQCLLCLPRERAEEFLARARAVGSKHAAI